MAKKAKPEAFEFKLGRRPPDPNKLTLRLAYYFDHEKLAAAAASLPEVVDYADKAGDSIDRVYLNDELGICVIAGKYHKAGMMSAEEGRPVRVGPDSEAEGQYRRICGPGDNGCVITRVLDEMVAGRFKVGGEIFPADGYAQVDASNTDLVKVATYLFGPLTYGIDMPTNWTGGNKIWDVTNAQIRGGHDVCTTGYNATGTPVATWGGINTITWAALAKGKWVQECYAVMAPEWYGSDKLTPLGVMVADLQKDMELLKQGRIPEIPPAALHRFEDLV